MATQNKKSVKPGAQNRATQNKTSQNRKKSQPKQASQAAMPNKEIIDEVVLWIVLAFSIFLLLSTFGIGGFIGDHISNFFFGTFGFLTYLMPFVLFFTVAFFISNKTNSIAWIKTVAVVVLLLSMCVVIELFVNGYEKNKTFMDFYEMSSEYKSGGGVLGGMLCSLFCPAIGIAGSYVLFIILILASIVLITERSLFHGMKKGGRKVYETARQDAERRKERADIRRAENRMRQELKLEELRQEEQQRRLDKKVTGVSLDTEVRPGTDFKPMEDVHEITAKLLSYDFTIERGTMPEPVEKAELIEDPITKQVAFKLDSEEEQVKEEPVQPVKRNTKPRTAKAEQEKAVESVTEEIKQGQQNVKPRYIFPPMNLLNKPSRRVAGNSDRELRETAMKLQQTLHNFGVEVTVTNVSCGPAVTRYELTPEQGVKVSKIVNLTDDIKLNLAAADIRIEAPIPGKAAVGIEVPNQENSAVLLRELLETSEFKDHPSNVAFAAGKDIAGKTVVADIAKMPHLLIAGATGSGKSVCINTIIMSILYKANPDDVKLIMIDPKVVELSVYNGIPHLLIPVVTDPKKAAGALNWGVAEMMERYNKFEQAGVRDIKGYNAKVAELDDIEDENKPTKLPQIVIIVDELADLMMVAPGEVEDSICRLAQLARAAGIHLIIATQRPSVNVITGLIKANMPSRIAFAVSSGVDSRTIIDMHGAEKLLGKGDMLFYPQGYQKPARVQGAFVSDKEVSAVVDFLVKKNTVSIPSRDIEAEINKVQQTQAAESQNGGSDVDEYFEKAGRFIIEKDKASIGMLQRVFKIGFNRAARIMDQLADAGVVGEEEGTKPRKVLMSMEQFETYIDEYV